MRAVTDKPDSRSRRTGFCPFAVRLLLNMPLRFPTFCVITCSFTLLLLSAVAFLSRLNYSGALAGGFVAAPEFDFIFQFNSLLSFHSFTNLFRQRQRVFRSRVFTFSHNEICMHWRN